MKLSMLKHAGRGVYERQFAADISRNQVLERDGDAVGAGGERGGVGVSAGAVEHAVESDHLVGDVTGSQDETA